MKRLNVVLLVVTFFGSLTLSSQIVSAGAGAPEEGCTGTWAFPPMYVGGEDGVVFASRAYEFDENCKPVLVEEIRLDYIPEWIERPEREPVEVKTATRTPPPPPTESGSSPEAVNTCHVKTWEEDAPGIDMIAVQDDQNYSWNGSTVTLGQGSTSAATYLSWWYVSSGPTGTGGYYSSQTAWANGQASFYCDGGPFCGGGPAYHITLKTYMTVDYLGGCGGYGTYSGTVVPFGRVLDSVWKS